MWQALIRIALVAAQITPAPSANHGVISVKVVDQAGVAISSAVVGMYPPPGVLSVGAIPECRTDSSGICTRKSLLLGTYVIWAKKPSDGYPDVSFDFYSHLSKSSNGRRVLPTVVNLTPLQPEANVVFKLGPKAAKLRIETIDDSSGARVDDKTIILRRADDPNDFISVGQGSGSTILIPPDEDIQIEVVAQGFKSWRSAEHAEVNHGKPLRFRTGESRDLTIDLKRR
jgi:hypothetical protein